MTKEFGLALVDKDDCALIFDGKKFILNPMLKGELKAQIQEMIDSGVNHVFLSLYTAGTLFHIMLEAFTKHVVKALLESRGVSDVSEDDLKVLRDVLKYQLMDIGYRKIFAKFEEQISGAEEAEGQRLSAAKKKLEAEYKAFAVEKEAVVQKYEGYSKFDSARDDLNSWLREVDSLQALRQKALEEFGIDNSEYKVSNVINVLNEVRSELSATNPGVAFEMLPSIPHTHVHMSNPEEELASYMELEDRVLAGTADVEHFMDPEHEVVRHILDSDRVTIDADGNINLVLFGKKTEQLDYLIQQMELRARRAGLKGEFKIAQMIFLDDRDVNLEAIKKKVASGNLSFVDGYRAVFCDKTTGMFVVKPEFNFARATAASASTGGGGAGAEVVRFEVPAGQAEALQALLDEGVDLGTVLAAHRAAATSGARPATPPLPPTATTAGGAFAPGGPLAVVSEVVEDAAAAPALGKSKP